MQENQKDFYVYIHRKPTGEIFYVGKGTKTRASRLDRKHNQRHTRIISKYGRENVRVSSMLCISNEHACNLEIRLIKALRDGGVDLCNVTAGGEGALGRIPNESTRVKISESVKRAAASQEWKERASIAARNRPPISEDTRQRMSEASKNQSKETREKQRLARLGRVESEATKQKRVSSFLETMKYKRENGLITPVSEETRLKLSQAAKGRKWVDSQYVAMVGRHVTKDTRENISKATTGVKKSRTEEGEKRRKEKCAETMTKKKEAGWVYRTTKPISDDTRRKLSEGRRGKKQSAATVEKRMETMRKKREQGTDNSQTKEAQEKRLASRRENAPPRTPKELERLDKRRAKRAAAKQGT